MSVDGPITPLIIGAAIRVHRSLGPGLLESSYKACLAMELATLHLSFERERALPLTYCGRPVNIGYRVDFLVEDRVIIEVKSVADLQPVHTAQLLSYLRLANRGIGLLFNFNVRVLTRGGIRRVLNGPLDPIEGTTFRIG